MTTHQLKKFIDNGNWHNVGQFPQLIPEAKQALLYMKIHDKRKMFERLTEATHADLLRYDVGLKCINFESSSEKFWDWLSTDNTLSELKHDYMSSLESLDAKSIPALVHATEKPWSLLEKTFLPDACKVMQFMNFNFKSEDTTDHSAISQDLPSVKYLSPEIYENDHRIVLVRSTTGTAKTTSVIDYIKKTKKKFIFISSRISLAKDFHRKTCEKDLPSKYYKDHKHKMYFGENVVIQYDSLGQLDHFVDAFKTPELAGDNDYVLYLDEINNLLNYLCSSSTLSNKRSTCFYVFLNFIKHASKVICTDNVISKITTEFFQTLCGKYDMPLPHFCYNEKKTWAGTKAHVYQDEGQFKKLITETINGGSKVNVVSDSKKYVDVYAHDLDPDGKWTVQTSDQEYIDVLDWADVTIYSPKIVIGVDDQQEKEVFLISTGKSVDSVDLYQMVCRCRKIKKLHIFFTNKEDQFKKSKYKTVDDVDDDIISSAEAYQEILSSYNVIQLVGDTKIKNFDSIFYTIFRQHLYIKDMYQTGISKHFMAILKDEEFTVTVDEAKPTKKRVVPNKETNVAILEKKIADFDPKSEAVKKINSILKLPKSVMDGNKDLFVDQYKLQQHFSTCKLMQNEEKLVGTLEKQVEECQYLKMKNANSRTLVLNKMAETLQLAGMHEVDGYDQHSTEAVEISDSLKLLYKGAYSNNKKFDACKTKGDMFQLYIQCLKGICGNDLVKSKKVRLKNAKKASSYKHTLNTETLEIHKALLRHRNPACTGLKDEFQDDLFID